MSIHKVLSCQTCGAELVVPKLEGAVCSCGGRAFSHTSDVEVENKKPIEIVTGKPAAEPIKLEPAHVAKPKVDEASAK